MITNPKIKKATRYISYLFNILLYIFIISLIRGESPFGKLGGWTILTIITLYNIYGIYKSKEYLKQIKQYIWIIAKEKAEQKKKKRSEINERKKNI